MGEAIRLGLAACAHVEGLGRVVITEGLDRQHKVAGRVTHCSSNGSSSSVCFSHEDAAEFVSSIMFVHKNVLNCLHIVGGALHQRKPFG